MAFFVGSSAFVHGPNVGPWQSIVTVKVTNHSSADKYIEDPFFITNTPDASGKAGFTTIDFDNATIFPLKLAPGEVFQKQFDAIPMRDNLRKNGCKKVKATVRDTFGNNYHSGWIKKTDIKS